MSAKMDVEGLYLCACHEFYDSHHPECPALRQYRQQAEEIERLKRDVEKWLADCRVQNDHIVALHEEHATLTRQLQEQAEEIARLKRANRTRHDYDLTCSQCGKAHILDTSLPSEIWNQIAQPEDILCTLCIDERLAAKGLSCLAEFYFVGDALTSKLYSQDLQEANATLTRQLQEAEDMANVGRSLMEQIESNAESLRGWHPLCDPAEIVVELINQRDEAESRLQEAVEKRDRYRKSLERIRLRAAPGPDDRNFDRCIQDLMWCDDEARRALTERSTD